jgi:T5orf172 domain
VSSNSDHTTGEFTGLPFVRPIIRRMAEELFREQSQRKSGVLVDRIVQLHRERGGANAPNPAFAVRRVLQDLRTEGLVVAPGHGWWRWYDDASDGRTAAESDPAESPATSADAIDEFQPAIRIEKEAGAGSECVYLYFNPNDRRFAELEGRDVWECKIGRTSGCDAIARILGQGIRTALPRLATVGLVLPTDDSAALENTLHSSLRLVGAEVPNSPRNEWFIASPERVEAWYARFEKRVSLKSGPSGRDPASKSLHLTGPASRFLETFRCPVRLVPAKKLHQAGRGKFVDRHLDFDVLVINPAATVRAKRQSVR